MQFVIWTGIVVLGLITVSSAGMIFFHLIGEFRRGELNLSAPSEEPMKRNTMSKVDLTAMKDDRSPIRRAA